MSEFIHPNSLKDTIDTLSLRAQKSKWLGSTAGVLGIIAGVFMAAPLEGPAIGLAAGFGGAVVAGLALARKIRFDRSISAIEAASGVLDEVGQQRLAEQLAELPVAQVTPESIGNLAKGIGG